MNDQPDTDQLRFDAQWMREWALSKVNYTKADRLDAAADELDRLRRWKAEATTVIEDWEKVHVALGSPGRLGTSKAAACLAEIQRRQPLAPAPSGEVRNG